ILHFPLLALRQNLKTSFEQHIKGNIRFAFCCTADCRFRNRMRIAKIFQRRNHIHLDRGLRRSFGKFRELVSQLHDDTLGRFFPDAGDRCQPWEIAFADGSNQSFDGATGKYRHCQPRTDSGNTDEAFEHSTLLLRRKTVKRHDVFPDVSMDVERHLHAFARHCRECTQWHKDFVTHSVRLYHETRRRLFNEFSTEVCDQASSTKSMMPMTDASIGEFGRPTEVIAENPS